MESNDQDINSWDKFCFLIRKFIRDDGRSDTKIPFLSLYRSTHCTKLVPEIVSPSICLVVQGSKKVFIGKDAFSYRVGDYLVTSVDMPLSGQIIKATPSEPLLAIDIALDSGEIVSLAANIDLEISENKEVTPGAYVGHADQQLQNVVLRLLKLLEEPEAISVLAHSVRRELTYRLLKKDGHLLYQNAIYDSDGLGIGQSINWLKEHFYESFKVETLAEMANMSVSSFHRKFKAVTTMTPLQYQKQLRLQEARRLLLSKQMDAATVGFTVGYESPSQFSREYRRLFGTPPIEDTTNLKNES